MKKLTSLLASLLIVFLVSMCSSPTDSDSEEEFEPYRVGTFLFTSPTKAKWTGSAKNKTKATSDTITVQSSDNKGIILTDREREREFFFIYIDSTVSDTVKIFRPHISYMDSERLLVGSHETSLNKDRFRLKIYMAYMCRYSRQLSDTLNVDYHDQSGEVTKTFQFYTDGFQEAVDDLVCN